MAYFETVFVGDNGKVLKAEVAAVVELPQEGEGRSFEFILKNGSRVVLTDSGPEEPTLDIRHQVRCWERSM